MKKFEKSKQVTRMYLKASSTLQDAELLLDEGRFAGAVSIAYFAVCHALKATLETQDLCCVKNSETIATFTKHVIGTKDFPKSFNQKIFNLRTKREIGDFDFHEIINEKDAKECLCDAKEIVISVRGFLSKKRYFPSL